MGSRRWNFKFREKILGLTTWKNVFCWLFLATAPEDVPFWGGTYLYERWPFPPHALETPKASDCKAVTGRRGSGREISIFSKICLTRRQGPKCHTLCWKTFHVDCFKPLISKSWKKIDGQMLPYYWPRVLSTLISAKWRCNNSPEPKSTQFD